MITLAYDGSNYSGWQIQPHSTSIQQKVLDAITLITKEPKIRLIGSGRTDAGVHALGQVAHFTLEKPLDSGKFLRSMNGLLPEDIRTVAVKEVPLDFHAQKSACGKIYHYYLCLEQVMLPFQKNYMLHVRKPIDISLLTQATQYFVGTHDFSAFANAQSEGACAKNPTRTIYSIDVVPTEHGIRLAFYGNGFLYKMVRNIVGMLLDVATHKRALQDIPSVLAGKDRRKSSKAVSPKGLFLIKVLYSEVASNTSTNEEKVNTPFF